MSLSSATLYTLTGSMNKFIVAFVGIWLFNESREPRYVASIAVGLAAGGLLPFVKVRRRGGRDGGAGGAAGGRSKSGASAAVQQGFEGFNQRPPPPVPSARPRR
jgi:hypothetical protein